MRVPKMVYKISNDGINGSIGRKAGRGDIRVPQLSIQTESRVANFLIKFVRFVLFIYDIISLPIYFLIQRPDKRAKESQRTRSEHADIDTWIKTDQRHFATNYSLYSQSNWRDHYQFNYRTLGTSKEYPTLGPHKYMGSTVSEIFANAVQDFSGRSCLGYRAVVTCPVLILNEEGKHVLEEKSFRSDYTWYTYEQIGRRVQDIASGLYHHHVHQRSRVLLYASTSLEWFIVSQSCFQLAAELVIASDINDVPSLKLMIEEAEIEFMLVSCDRLPLLCQLLENISQDESSSVRIKRIVLIDWQFTVDFTEPAFANLRNVGEHIVAGMLSLGQVEEIGVEEPIEMRCTRSLQQHDQPQLNFDSVPHGKPRDTSRSMSVSATWQSAKLDADSKDQLSQRRRKRSRSLRRLINGANYTITNELQLDSKSSSPRLSVDGSTPSRLVIAEAPKPNDLAMIIYTYGSMGQLKAVMLTHGYLARSNDYPFLDGMVHVEDIHCTILPLDNLIEFMTEMCVFSHGGCIGYSCNQNTLFYDGKELFQRDRSDLEALNPTFLLVRPYILERLRSSIQNYLNFQLNPLVSFLLVDVLYEYKKFWARRHFGTPIIDNLFCSGLKRLFGRNLKYILCNGATDCSETKDFFAFMVNIPVIELYGPDEAAVSLISVNDIWDLKRRKPRHGGQSAAAGWRWFGERDQEEEDEILEDYKDIQLMPPKKNTNMFRENSSKNLLITSSILCPILGTRIRLEDWEDFRTSDQPYPRGRLVIGGDVVCKGYFKRDQSASRYFYVDSNFIRWFRTDDIARVFPNGSFEIISGMLDMIKMLDGQFISLSQIDHILRNSQFVDNVCTICGADRKFVVALVVPNLRRLALKSPGEANLKMAIGTEPEPEELTDIEFRREVCNDRLLCEFVSEHLSELIAKAGFQSIPSRFHLIPEIWTPETELVTPSFEPKRLAIQKYYASDIQSLFKMELTPSGKRLSSRVNKLRKRQSFNK